MDPSFSGVLLLDKCSHISSNQALQQLKSLLKISKAGHTGTLDPMATGILPILLGYATRYSQLALDATKTYQAVIQLGYQTSTADAEGEMINQAVVDFHPSKMDELKLKFLGTIWQTPPMYSALKKNGLPLYVYARRGETVERTPRKIEILQLELAEITPSSLGRRLVVSVQCSKGTYIRTLAEDMAQFLGTYGYLASLRRVQCGPFQIDQAVSFENLQKLTEEERRACILPLDSLFKQLPRWQLNNEQLQSFLQGKKFMVEDTNCSQISVYHEGRFVGLGAIEAGCLCPKRLLPQTESASI
ncbi:MAG: tRNA pseudouridine(55) synthase TruB [Gammaproteobacteria bacterium]|nr:tRNA pseudouridine(55) synthase TruB [Gammaproteobacteria bacterium]